MPDIEWYASPPRPQGDSIRQLQRPDPLWGTGQGQLLAMVLRFG